MAANSPRRILVVDDNADVCEMLKMLLELDGHDVRMAHDGSTAISTTQEYRPQVVLLDIGLPDMSGFAVARELRQIALDERPIIIAVSGYTDDEDLQRTLDAGFDHFVLKPATLKELKKFF